MIKSPAKSKSLKCSFTLRPSCGFRFKNKNSSRNPTPPVGLREVPEVSRPGNGGAHERESSHKLMKKHLSQTTDMFSTV